MNNINEITWKGVPLRAYFEGRAYFVRGKWVVVDAPAGGDSDLWLGYVAQPWRYTCYGIWGVQALSRSQRFWVSCDNAGNLVNRKGEGVCYLCAEECDQGIRFKDKYMRIHHICFEVGFESKYGSRFDMEEVPFPFAFAVGMRVLFRHEKKWKVKAKKRYKELLKSTGVCIRCEKDPAESYAPKDDWVVCHGHVEPDCRRCKKPVAKAHELTRGKEEEPTVCHGHFKTPDGKYTESTWSKYGIDAEDWARMYEAQGGKCRGCDQKLKFNRSTHVDHCRETGKVRGLLCHGCNVALGHVRENENTLNRLTEYLRVNAPI